MIQVKLPGSANARTNTMAKRRLITQIKIAEIYVLFSELSLMDYHLETNGKSSLYFM